MELKHAGCYIARALSYEVGAARPAAPWRGGGAGAGGGGAAGRKGGRAAS